MLGTSATENRMSKSEAVLEISFARTDKQSDRNTDKANSYKYTRNQFEAK